MFHFKTKFLTLFFIVSMSLVISGCYPHSVQYDWGWTTRTIRGVMKEENRLLNSKGFIVVQEYHALFAQVQESPIYVPRTRVLFPDSDGNFDFAFDLKASKIELHWIASGYVMQRFLFQRQIGVGDLNYRAIMQKTEAWKEHLSLHIIPFLQKFIIEKQYQMPNNAQLFLGEWIAQEQNHLKPQK